jgi:hypothetical protein
MQILATPPAVPGNFHVIEFDSTNQDVDVWHYTELGHHDTLPRRYLVLPFCSVPLSVNILARLHNCFVFLPRPVAFSGRLAVI